MKASLLHTNCEGFFLLNYLSTVSFLNTITKKSILKINVMNLNFRKKKFKVHVAPLLINKKSPRIIVH